jgi:hypothetical protein
MDETIAAAKIGQNENRQATLQLNATTAQLQVSFHAETYIIKFFAEVAIRKEFSHHDSSRHVALVFSNTTLQEVIDVVCARIP